MLEVKSEYKMTELGEIPVDWEVYKLGRYVKLQGGYAFKSSKFLDEGIKILRISNIKEWGLYLNECKYYSDKDVVGLDDYYLKENDTVIAMSGATTGKSTLVKKTDLPLLVNQRVGTYKQKNEAKVDQKFIHYTVSSDYYQQKLWEHAIGGAQPNISSSQLESIVIAYPPLKEQQKIAKILSTVDEQIEQTNQLIKKTKELKQGLMQQLLTKGIGHTIYKNSKFGEIPIEWKIVGLENISERITKKNKNNEANNVLTISAQQGLVSQTAFFNKKVASKNLTGYYLLQKGDFAFNKSYSKGYPMGAIKSLKLYDLGVVSSLYICFRLKQSHSQNFYDYYFDSNLWHKDVAGIAQEGARNHGLLNINTKSFFDIDVLLPPLEEQKKIVEILFAVDEEIEGYEEEKAKYEELKKGLMQQLLTGKTRVKVD